MINEFIFFGTKKLAKIRRCVSITFVEVSRIEVFLAEKRVFLDLGAVHILRRPGEGGN